jgi:hypothetical protein
MMYMAILNIIRGTWVDYAFMSSSSVVGFAIIIWIITAFSVSTVFIGYTTDNPSSQDDKYEEIPPDSRKYD